MEKEQEFLGFSSLDELKEAYLALAHTAASAVKEEAPLCDVPVPQYERSDWDERVQAFLVAVPEGRNYGKQIAGMLARDENLSLKPNALELALIKLLVSELENAGNSHERAKELALTDPEIKDAVIKEYLASFDRRVPKAITGGGSTVVTPPKAPKSIREATQLVKQLFNN